MKRKLVGALLGCCLSASCVFQSYAGDLAPNLGQYNKSVLLESASESTGYAKQARGMYISTGSIRISNEGKGKIGVYMKTLCHQDVDETTFTVFLDRWIESEQRWANVGSTTYTFNKENSPGEDLSSKSISFNIVGQPTDCYYRLRGMHLVVMGDVREMLASETDGIQLTK